MKLKQRFFTLIVMVFSFMMVFSGCKKQVITEFNTKEELAHKVVELINSGENKVLFSTLIQKDDYINNYYKYLPESKQKNALKAEEFYGMFIAYQRINAIKGSLKRYSGRIEKIISVGEPDKVIKTGKFDILRRVPIKMIIKDENGKTEEIVDNNFLGVVILENNKYRLMNIFI